LILAEVNIKSIEYITDTAGILVKKIRPNFKVLGKKVGGLMKDTATAIGVMSQADILQMEQAGVFSLQVGGQPVEIALEDVEILSEDIPGWQVASEGRITVALDITITEELREEGIAREMINRIQNLRKESQFEVTDRIEVQIQDHAEIRSAIRNNKEYICAEILATSLEMVPQLDTVGAVDVEVDDLIQTRVLIRKHSAATVNG
jgi:isoleucyl-tRNA synthetase